MKFTLIVTSCMILLGCAPLKPAATGQLILEVPKELLEKPAPLKQL